MYIVTPHHLRIIKCNIYTSPHNLTYLAWLSPLEELLIYDHYFGVFPIHYLGCEFIFIYVLRYSITTSLLFEVRTVFFKFKN